MRHNARGPYPVLTLLVMIILTAAFTFAQCGDTPTGNQSPGIKPLCLNPDCGSPGYPQCTCKAYSGLFNYPTTVNLSDPAATEHGTGNHTWYTTANNTSTYTQGGACWTDGQGYQVCPCVSTAKVTWNNATIGDSGLLSKWVIDPGDWSHHMTASSHPGSGGPSAPDSDLYVYGEGAAVTGSCSTLYLAINGNCGETITWSGLTPIFGNNAVNNAGYNVWTPSAPSVSYAPAEVASGQGTPIVIDLDGLDFKDAFTSPEDGVVFAVVPGQSWQTSWTARGRNVGFLALHRMAYDEDEMQTPLPPPPDWKVRDGRELFGNWTNQRPSKVPGGPRLKPGQKWEPNGFYALAVFDLSDMGGNSDGWIDSADAVWPYLRVWVDTAHDGDSRHGVIYTLDELGIKRISTHFTDSSRMDQYGNALRYRGTIEMEKSASVAANIYDVYFHKANAKP